MHAKDRLGRMLEARLGSCCDADVDERLRELTELAESASVPDADADVTALSTLGDATRYRLARLLAEDGSEHCVCELAPLVEVSDSALSHALSDLTAAGLVERRKEGKWRFYRATDRTERLLDALDSTRDR